MSRSDGRQAVLGGVPKRPEWFDRLETVVDDLIGEEWGDLPETIIGELREYEAPLAASNYKSALHAPELTVDEDPVEEDKAVALRVQPACGHEFTGRVGHLRETRSIAEVREVCGRGICQEAAAEIAAISGVREEFELESGEGGSEAGEQKPVSERLPYGLLEIDPETLPEGDEAAWREAVRRLYAWRGDLDGWRTGAFDDAELEEVLADE